ncbi:flagellar biosynthetic protein FliR [Methylobacillus pratensis]
MTGAVFFTWIFGVLLVSTRLSVLFISAPVFGSVPVPARAKIILIVGLAAGLASTVNIPSMSGFNPEWLISAMLSELLIGAAMAAALFAGFGAFHFGGRLLDFQSGYGIASLVDLATRNNAPLIGSLLTMLAVLVFFLVDGHLAMLKVLQLSFTAFPIGAGIAKLDIGLLIAYFGSCFVFGFAIVAPVVLCLFLVDMGMAFMSRTMPQMNVFVMSLGLKVLVGWVVLAIAVPFSGGLVRSVFESIFNVWNKVLG